MSTGPVRAPPPLAGASGPRSRGSPASIAPVGLELAEEVVDEPPKVQQTGSVRIPLQRRRLGGVVVAAVATCALILVAAIIARVSHASNEPPPAAARPISMTATTATTTAGAPTQPQSFGGAQPAPAAVAPPAPEPPTTGTVRLERPATTGRVWLDGKKMTSGSAVVSCGAHQVKIGRGRTRSVQVPCGGEIVVSK
jgi:hypothetical protein